MPNSCYMRHWYFKETDINNRKKQNLLVKAFKNIESYKYMLHTCSSHLRA